MQISGDNIENLLVNMVLTYYLVTFIDDFIDDRVIHFQFQHLSAE